MDDKDVFGFMIGPDGEVGDVPPEVAAFLATHAESLLMNQAAGDVLEIANYLYRLFKLPHAVEFFRVVYEGTEKCAAAKEYESIQEFTSFSIRFAEFLFKEVQRLDQ